LAPYSRDLSPMEWCWSKLKQWWRCHPAGSYEGLYQALTLAVTPITEDDAFGWFAHCGLFF
ncbi:MAG: IS630 family transposase, partial [Cyanobacteria bacterium QS_1_48_34]